MGYCLLSVRNTLDCDASFFTDIGEYCANRYIHFQNKSLATLICKVGGRHLSIYNAQLDHKEEPGFPCVTKHQFNTRWALKQKWLNSYLRVIAFLTNPDKLDVSVS
jgi:hypothetical protein